MALAVLFFIMNSTLLRPLLALWDDERAAGVDNISDPVVIQAWKDIVNVIIGALAGYIGSHIQRREPDDRHKKP